MYHVPCAIADIVCIIRAPHHRVAASRLQDTLCRARLESMQHAPIHVGFDRL